MIRKIILRVLMAGFAFLLLVLVGIATCCWLATQPPRFYSDLMQQQYTAADQELVRQRFEELGESIEIWARHSQSLQRTGTNKDQASPTLDYKSLLKAIITPTIEEDRQVVISEHELNTMLAFNDPPGGDLKDVRIKFADDRIQLAGALTVDELPTLYPSIDLRMNVEPDGAFSIELLAGRIGRIPIPLGSILNLLGDELNRDKDVLFDLDASNPTITICPSEFEDGALRLDQICCKDGNLILKISVPSIAY